MNKEHPAHLDEARLDVVAREFWAAVPIAFFDIRVFISLQDEKKSEYNNRVMNVGQDVLHY